MSGGEFLTLSTSFGERDRVDGELLADELLDLYERHRLRSSILTRGSQGFGRLHHLRDDRLLSLSEDLPVMSWAVDRRESIEAVLEPLLEIMQRGLITLQRSTLITGGLADVTLGGALEDAVKLTVSVGRRERTGGRPAFAAVCDLLHRHGAAGATTLLGVDGTPHGRRARASFFGGNRDVPMTIVAVGERETIARALPELERLLEAPLLTLEPVQVCKRDGRLLAPPPLLPSADESGREIWQKLTIYSSQAATVDGQPLDSELIRRLRRSESAGATSLRGVWGFHGDHRPHGDRLLQVRRHVPVMTITIDTPQRIAESFEIVDELTREHGLVTSEPVSALHALSAEATLGGLGLSG